MIDIIKEFIGNISYEQIIVTLLLAVEYWLGKTDMVKPGSTLEAILNGLKYLLEMLKPKTNNKE